MWWQCIFRRGIQPLMARWIMFYFSAYFGFLANFAFRGFCHFYFSGSYLPIMDSRSTSNCADDMWSRPSIYLCPASLQNSACSTPNWDVCSSLRSHGRFATPRWVLCLGAEQRICLSFPWSTLHWILWSVSSNISTLSANLWGLNYRFFETAPRSKMSPQLIVQR